MKNDIKGKINRIVDLERSYLDHNETTQKTDKRIWSIANRVNGPKDDGMPDKTVVGKLQRAVIAGKCDNPMLASLTSTLVGARNLMATRQDEIAAEMVALGTDLPTHDWFVSHRGLKDILFVRLIANAGADLNEFPTPAHLWSRFGLAVVDGKAMKPKSGQTLGFSPRRRAFVIGVIGTNLLMQNPKWKKVYDWRKQYERDRAAANGITVVPASAISEKRKATGKFMSDGHVHARARRYMVKQFLKAWWEEWTGQSKPEELPGFITAVGSLKRKSEAA